jgi:hypothetical protein
VESVEGRTVREEQARAAPEGLTLAVPAFVRDLACRITRAGQ